MRVIAYQRLKIDAVYINFAKTFFSISHSNANYFLKLLPIASILAYAAGLLFIFCQPCRSIDADVEFSLECLKINILALDQ